MFELTAKEIATLERMGFRRWRKYGHDRLYADPETLGYNFWGQTFNGERLTDAEVDEMFAAKTYVDLLNDCEVHSPCKRLWDACVRIVANVIYHGGEMEDDDDDREYTSASAGDYSPNCPWKAPGMCISDFITGVRNW